MVSSIFKISKLFGKYDIELPINNNVFILIGENGTGKTTIMKLLFNFSFNLFSELIKYDFEKLCYQEKSDDTTVLIKDLNYLDLIPKDLSYYSNDSQEILKLFSTEDYLEVIRRFARDDPYTDYIILNKLFEKSIKENILLINNFSKSLDKLKSDVKLGINKFLSDNKSEILNVVHSNFYNINPIIYEFYYLDNTIKRNILPFLSNGFMTTVKTLTKQDISKVDKYDQYESQFLKNLDSDFDTDFEDLFEEQKLDNMLHEYYYDEETNHFCNSMEYWDEYDDVDYDYYDDVNTDMKKYDYIVSETGNEKWKIYNKGKFSGHQLKLNTVKKMKVDEKFLNKQTVDLNNFISNYFCNEEDNFSDFEKLIDSSAVKFLELELTKKAKFYIHHVTDKELSEFKDPSEYIIINPTDHVNFIRYKYEIKNLEISMLNDLYDDIFKDNYALYEYGIMPFISSEILNKQFNILRFIESDKLYQYKLTLYILKELKSIYEKIMNSTYLSSIANFEKLLNRYLYNRKAIVYPKSLVIKTNDNKIIPLSELSSGETNLIIIFAITVLANVKNLIIDEPEVSMSIDWQKNLIDDIVKHSDTNILIATHSPFLFNDSLLDSVYHIEELIGEDHV